MTDEPGWAGETRQLDADVLGELVGGLDGKSFLVAGPPRWPRRSPTRSAAPALPEDRVLVGRVLAATERR